MIIVGYQGIGKSTLAKNSNKYIDLESGNFWIGDERQDDWYKIYCKIATDLSRQGYTVFVSSHYVVRKGLRQYSRTEEVKCCFPDISLRDKWIKKLEDRYHNSKLEKDYRAWQHAKDFYVRDIQNLSTDSFESICIKSMDYNLKELIENKEPSEDTGELSDGYHTFNQLYHQRAVLFACIVKQNKNKAWKSFKHSDGKYCFDSNGEWFIVGIDTPQGSYTYHYAKEYWDMFDCQELECGKEWDGHTEEDVTRLLSLEQETSEDCIRREDAIDLIADFDLTMDQVVRGIHALPPVTPSRPKGHWISHIEHCEKLGLKPSGLGAYEWCSNCDCGIDINEFHRIHYNFCPKCGADMTEREE